MMAEAAEAPEIPKAAWRTLAITSVVGFMVSLEITVISLARAEIADAFPDAFPEHRRVGLGGGEEEGEEEGEEGE